jgi:phosphomannomutase/phosphoglucomutase
MSNVELLRSIGLVHKIEAIKDLPKTVYIDARVRNPPAGLAFEIGQSLADKLNEVGQEFCLLSGDGRYSTPMILEEFVESLTRNNIKVLYAGCCNITPMFEVERKRLGVTAVSVTASHQAADYNGFKLCIEANSNSYPDLSGMPQRSNNNKVYEAQSVLRKSYLEHVLKTVSKFDVSPDVKILYDALQGVSYPFFKEVAAARSVSFDAIREYHNPYFTLTAGGPDPSLEENFSILQRLCDLSKYKAILMVDGDGDRFGAAVNEKIPPPVLAALLAEYRGKRNNGGTFVAEHCVATVIEDYLQKSGIKTVRSDRGRTKIIPVIETTPDTIGGAEYALHLYLEDGIDDGLVNSFEFLAIASLMDKKSLNNKIREVSSGIRHFVPELRTVYTIPTKKLLDGIGKDMSSLFGSVENYDGMIYEKPGLFVMVRPSSNEKSVVVSVNGKDQKSVYDAYDMVCNMLYNLDESTNLYRGAKTKTARTEDQELVRSMLSKGKPSKVFWIHESTQDIKFKVSDPPIRPISGHYAGFLRRISKMNYDPAIVILEDIARNGRLEHDVEIVLESSVLAEESQRIIRECSVDNVKLGQPVIVPGGSPCFSAMHHFLFALEEPNIARAAYAGSFPLSVQEYISSNKHLEPLFELAWRNSYQPRTISFETWEHKLMLSNSTGRRLQDIRSDDHYHINLEKLVSSAGNGKIAFAIGGLNKGRPEEYLDLIRWLRHEVPTALVFVGTNSFKKHIQAQDYHTMEKYYDVLKQADLVSMNDAELDQLHQALYGKQSMGLAMKLVTLSHPGLAIVHAAQGAAAHLGPNVKNERTTKSLTRGILQLAVDATSRCYETGLHLKNMQEAIDYGARQDWRRHNVHDAFGTAGHHDVVYAASPIVAHPLGNLTGIGAIMDSYVMALITPLHKQFFNPR